MILSIPTTHAQEFEEREEAMEWEEMQDRIWDYLKNDEEGIALHAFLKEEMPEGTLKLLNSSIEEDPFRAEGLIDDALGVYFEYTELLERDEELAKRFLTMHRHEARSYALALEIETLLENAGDTDEANRLKEELREELEESFDLKLELQKTELSMLEGEVQDLRELLEKRAAAREKIIEHRLDELTGANAHLEW